MGGIQAAGMVIKKSFGKEIFFTSIEGDVSLSCKLFVLVRCIFLDISQNGIECLLFLWEIRISG